MVTQFRLVWPFSFYPCLTKCNTMQYKKPTRNTGGAMMSKEKDSMLRVRLTQRQSDELDSIIGELQAQIPEASVTTSSIARYALEKYVSDHIAKRDGTKIFIEVSTADATDEDIKNLYDLLSGRLTKQRIIAHRRFIT